MENIFSAVKEKDFGGFSENGILVWEQDQQSKQNNPNKPVDLGTRQAYQISAMTFAFGSFEVHLDAIEARVYIRGNHIRVKDKYGENCR